MPVHGHSPLVSPKPAERPLDRPALPTVQAHVEVLCDRPQTTEIHQLTDQPSTDHTPAMSHQIRGPSGLQTTQVSDLDMDTDSDSDPTDQWFC